MADNLAAVTETILTRTCNCKGQVGESISPPRDGGCVAQRLERCRRFIESRGLGLYGQVNKRIRWMPWQSEAMKDVVACDKLWGVGKQTVIQRSLNGGTQPAQAGYLVLNT